LKGVNVVKTVFNTTEVLLVNPKVQFRGQPAEMTLEGLWELNPDPLQAQPGQVQFRFVQHLDKDIDLSKYQAHKDALDELGSVQDEDDSYW